MLLKSLLFSNCEKKSRFWTTVLTYHMKILIDYNTCATTGYKRHPPLIAHLTSLLPPLPPPFPPLPPPPSQSPQFCRDFVLHL